LSSSMVGGALVAAGGSKVTLGLGPGAGLLFKLPQPDSNITAVSPAIATATRIYAAPTLTWRLYIRL
jgi:hypothetical protein